MSSHSCRRPQMIVAITRPPSNWKMSSTPSQPSWLRCAYQKVNPRADLQIPPGDLKDEPEPRRRTDADVLASSRLRGGESEKVDSGSRADRL